MIYQLNHEFKVFLFKATVFNEVYYLNDKQEFESSLSNKEDIFYEDVVLTEEQMQRLNFISKIRNVSLDEVVEYTVNGVEPENPNFKVLKLEMENIDLKIALAELLGVG